MERCDVCKRVVPKDAARVERGKSYTCSTCIMILAKQVEDKTPEIRRKRNPERKIRHRSFKGSERSLANFDMKNPFKSGRKESGRRNSDSTKETVSGGATGFD